MRQGSWAYEVGAALIRELERERPTVVVLEDLHWADEATLDLLRTLGRRIEATEAVAIATFRDDELDRAHPLRIALGELVSAPAVRRLSLQPLSREAVGELAMPYGVDRDELYRMTGGNPFFVTEVLAAPSPEIPATVRDAVRAGGAPRYPRPRTARGGCRRHPPRRALATRGP